MLFFYFAPAIKCAPQPRITRGGRLAWRCVRWVVLWECTLGGAGVVPVLRAGNPTPRVRACAPVVARPHHDRRPQRPAALQTRPAQ
eukprot:5529217-Prymnesium_polylepis.1